MTDLGWFAELPDNVVLKLEAADRESIIDYLFEALRLFVQYPEPFLKMGREAGCYVRARHSPTAIAAAYYQLMTGAQPARSNLKPI